jgi:hypothetical protein
MIDRGRLFNTPTYLWLPANGTITAEYWAVAQPATSAPDRLEMPSPDRR